MTRQDIVIVGAGASGYFAAANCDANRRVLLLEGSPRVLTKVKISGGGRCNVTHNILEPKKLSFGYPRGAKELLGPLTRFGPKETIDWFSERGVELKSESDGRMFPLTDKSQTIIDCLSFAAKEKGVELKTGFIVKSIGKTSDGFLIVSNKGEEIFAKKVLFASGSSPACHKIAADLGHRIVRPVPSLFTFTIDDPLLNELPGISFKRVSIELDSLKSEGPLLITHWGLSGPAVLKLSAFAARILHACEYQKTIRINWLFDYRRADLLARFQTLARENGAERVWQKPQFELPKRFWERLLTVCHIKPEQKFADLSKVNVEKILDLLTKSQFAIRAKGEFKEEFVTAGGILLDEVDFRSMESKVCPGLYFAGEILDIDGITGGFNFQNAWTTAFIAMKAMLDSFSDQAIS